MTNEVILTKEELEDVNETLSLVNKEFTREQAEKFFKEHRIVYYDGKRWGFTDTVVREDLCELVEKLEG